MKLKIKDKFIIAIKVLLILFFGILEMNNRVYGTSNGVSAGLAGFVLLSLNNDLSKLNLSEQKKKKLYFGGVIALIVFVFMMSTFFVLLKNQQMVEKNQLKADVVSMKRDTKSRLPSLLDMPDLTDASGNLLNRINFTQVSIQFNPSTGELFPVFEKKFFGVNCLWSWIGDHGLSGVFTTDNMTTPIKKDRMGSGMVDVDVVCTNSIDGWFEGHYSDSKSRK